MCALPLADQQPPTDTPAALAGFRVLELGHPAVAYGGKLLADLGADVILVEPPEGDACRRLGPFSDDR